MILRNTEKYCDLIEYNPENGIERKYSIDNKSKEATNGFYSVLERKLFGLGVYNEELWVIINANPYRASGILVMCIKNKNDMEFAVTKNNQQIYSITYKPKKAESYFCYSEDDEDVDILLFISNVLSSEERTLIFMGNN